MPFAGYKDFADCVARNQDKDDPNAYCAAIMSKVEHPRRAKVSGKKSQANITKPNRIVVSDKPHTLFRRRS